MLQALSETLSRYADGWCAEYAEGATEWAIEKVGHMQSNNREQELSSSWPPTTMDSLVFRQLHSHSSFSVRRQTRY